MNKPSEKPAKPWETKEWRSRYTVKTEGVETLVQRSKASSLLQISGEYSFFGRWRSWGPDIGRFVWRVYKLDPTRALLQILYSVLSSMLPSLKLFYSTKLIGVALKAVETRRFNRTRGFVNLAALVGTTMIQHAVTRLGGENEAILKTLISGMIKEHIMEARLRLDVGSFARPAVATAFENVQEMVSETNWGGPIPYLLIILKQCLSIATQLSIILQCARNPAQRLYIAINLLAVFPADLRWMVRSLVRGRINTTSEDFQITESSYKAIIKASNHTELKVLGLGQALLNRFQRHRERLGPVSTTLNRPNRPHWSLILYNSFSTSIQTLVFAYRAGSKDGSSLSLAEFNFVRGISSDLADGFVILFNALGAFQSQVKSIQSFFALQTIVPSVSEPSNPTPYKSDHNGMSIEFQEVSFGYPNGKDVLKKVSFKVEPGQVVAVVGENGSGKSTLVSLLARSYDASSGQILINGTSIKDYSVADLHSHMSVLFQQVDRLELTVKEFIGMSSPSKQNDQSAIETIAKLVGVHSTILSKPQGYESDLGDYIVRTEKSFLMECMQEDWKEQQERFRTSLEKESAELRKAQERGQGAEAAKEAAEEIRFAYIHFSGGEWRKIACARALFRDADLRIWDEFASGLDSMSEKKVFREIWSCRGSATTFFVTHRYASTPFADLILCLKEGELVEQGSHEELMAKKGHYFKLYEAAQLSGAEYLRNATDHWEEIKQEDEVTDEELSQVEITTGIEDRKSNNEGEEDDPHW